MADANLKIVGTFKDGISKKLDGIKSKSNGLKSSLLKMGGALTAAFSIGKIGTSLFNVNREMETLQATIRTFSTSAEDAARSMALIKDFAEKTPFTLNEVTKSFARMKALGIEPTRESLEAFGNIAAGTGESILKFTEAVADAAVGEFERLKEFGIKASKQGDEVSFLFKGVTTTIKNSSENIQRYLREIGEVEFAGAMANKMDTLDGSVSTLGTSWDNLMLAFGNTGATDGAKRGIDAVSDALTGMVKKVSGIQFAISSVVAAFEIGFEHIRHATLVFEQAVQLIFFGLFDTINSVWNTLMESILGGINLVIRGANALGAEIDLIDSKMASIAYFSTEIKAAVQEERVLHEANLKAINDGLDARKKELQAYDRKIAKVGESSTATDKDTSSTNDNTNATDKNTKKKKEQLTVYESLIKEIDDQRLVTEQAWEAMTMLDEAFQDGKISSEEYAEGLEKLNDKLGIVDDTMKDTAKSAKAVETVFSRTMKKIQSSRKEIAETGQAVEQLNAAYARGDITFREYTDAMKGYQSTLKDASFASSDLARINGELQSSFGDLFGDLITGSGDAKRSLSSLISTFIDYVFASNEAASSSSPMSGGTSSGTSSGGLFSGIGDFIGGAVSGIGDFFGGFFAGGGFTPGNLPIVVGEKGPELFMPSGPGNVISNDKMSGMGNNLTFNIQTLDGADTMRVLSQHRREIAEMVSGTQRTFGI